MTFEERETDIFDRLSDHYSESLDYFPNDRIVGLFLQGSQNYGLDTPQSDVDTKLIVVPSFKDIAMNHKPVSTTHVRANDEHIDFKDIRLYMGTFRKQNLNFLEILFTDYHLVNDMYVEQWDRLVERREEIARFNVYRGIKSMKGIAMEKYYAMQHEYPSKLEILAKYGYDPKQVHHLIRVEEYLERYINGEKYEDCLRPRPENLDLIVDMKAGKYTLEEAQPIADRAIAHVLEMEEKACAVLPNEENQEISDLLDDVQYEIMKIATEVELK